MPTTSTVPTWGAWSNEVRVLAIHHEPSTRQDAKYRAKPESVSDKSGGGSPNETAKSDQ